MSLKYFILFIFWLFFFWLSGCRWVRLSLSLSPTLLCFTNKYNNKPHTHTKESEREYKEEEEKKGLRGRFRHDAVWNTRQPQSYGWNNKNEGGKSPSSSSSRKNNNSFDYEKKKKVEEMNRPLCIKQRLTSSFLSPLHLLSQLFFLLLHLLLSMCVMKKRQRPFNTRHTWKSFSPHLFGSEPKGEKNKKNLFRVIFASASTNPGIYYKHWPATTREKKASRVRDGVYTHTERTQSRLVHL